jgi:hypothetical protein
LAQAAHRLVSGGRRVDLIIGNNKGSVPDLNDFTAGMALMLAPQGVITLVSTREIDRETSSTRSTGILRTFRSSLPTVSHTGMRFVFDVEQLTTHGSLRVYLAARTPTIQSRHRLRYCSRTNGAPDMRTLTAMWLSLAVHCTSASCCPPDECKRRGARICGYGAPGKGNTC